MFCNDQSDAQRLVIVLLYVCIGSFKKTNLLTNLLMKFAYEICLRICLLYGMNQACPDHPAGG